MSKKTTLETFGIKVENLDGISLEELQRVSIECRRAAKAIEAYGRYAAHKAMAVRLRESGRVDEALREEERCDWIYRTKLPEEVKW